MLESLPLPLSFVLAHLLTQLSYFSLKSYVPLLIHIRKAFIHLYLDPEDR